MTHHVPHMKDNLICSTDCACCIMLIQWITSPIPVWIIQRVQACEMSHPVINRTHHYMKAIFGPRVFSHPISQLASWPYTEKGLPLITAIEKDFLQFWDPHIVMFCKIANHWPGGFMETRVRGISSHFHDGVPMQRLCQYLLQKRWFEKTQRIRSWRRSLFVWQMFQNVQQKGRVRKTRTYLFHNM